MKKDDTGCWWLTPVILATQKAVMRRITVQSQPGQIVHETLWKKPNTRIKENDGGGEFNYHIL
jgi:hypothetical protein